MATFKNLDKALVKYKKLGNIDLRKATARGAKVVQGQVKTLAPYASIKPSIKTRTKIYDDRIESKVYSNLEYAPYVEFGTGSVGNGTYKYPVKIPLSYKGEPWVYFNEKYDTFLKTNGMKAQPFMYPGLKMSEKKAKDVFADSIKRQVRKLIREGGETD